MSGRSGASVVSESSLKSAEPLATELGLALQLSHVTRSSGENIQAVWRHFMPPAALYWPCKLMQNTFFDGSLQTRSSSPASFYLLY